MNEENLAVNTDQSAATDNADTSTAKTEIEDAEARIAQLEADKARLIEESANYKLGMLKAKGKVKEESFEDETEDERIARIVQEKLSQTKMAQLDAEKEALTKRLAKENKELKLALQNKTKDPAAALGAHSESMAVRDTSITPEQMAAFKAKGWTDKDIERYKKNLSRYAR